MRLSCPALLVALTACHPSRPAGPSTGPAPPPSAGPVDLRTLGPVTARDGVLPWQTFDKAEGVCNWQVYVHLDGLATDTGALRWSAPDWTNLLGELADGSLVVDNSGFGGRGPYRVAVLDRRDGQPRAACAAGFDSQAMSVAWARVDGVLVGLPFQRQGPSGVARQPPPPVPAVQVTFADGGCTFGPATVELEASVGVPGSQGPWTDGTLEIRLDAEAPMAPDRAAPRTLVVTRGDATLWTHDVTGAWSPPCNLP